MELTNIAIGLSQHFSGLHWQNETKYLKLCIEEMEKNLHIHHKAASSAFQNILAFLKSIDKTNEHQTLSLYDSILKADPYNLNALYGLHEITSSTDKKKEYEQKVKEILCSEIQKTAVTKAIIEIGIALCLLAPRYDFVKANSDESHERCEGINLDGYEALVFQAENIPLATDLCTDTHIAQKKNLYNSVQYLKEGIQRMNDIEPGQKKDEAVWKFFLAKSYKKLHNWVAQTHGSRELRNEFSMKALGLFCEVAPSSDPNGGDKYGVMYYQQCLGYIGEILGWWRGRVLTIDFIDDPIPEFSDFIAELREKPEDAFIRALEYGYDPIVNTRHAKYLLREGNYDACIAKIKEVFDYGDNNSYAACIRMVAYKQKHTERLRNAKQRRDLSALTNEYLLKAEADGKYCFETFATAMDQLNYAKILRWLGTFPDGKAVTDESKIKSALFVLNRIYEEQGCHTHFKVHNTIAECHKDIGDLDKAIKYAIWSLNSTPDADDVFSFSFSTLISFLLKKFEQDTDTHETKRCLLNQMRYYIQSEIARRCQTFIEAKLKDIQAKNETLASSLRALLKKYDKRTINEIKHEISETILDQQLKDDLLRVIKNFGILFSIVWKWCHRFPYAVKSLLDFIIDTAVVGPLQTFVTMSLICLGRNHKEWTQLYNRKRKKIIPKTGPSDLDLFMPNLKDHPEKERYDFLIIYAPEDIEWVFYTFLPEMEQRPITFQGCIPDRDFKKGESFEKNVTNSLAKTTKVLLALSNNFLKHHNELLGDERCLLRKIDELHNKKDLGVMILLLEPATIGLDEQGPQIVPDNIVNSNLKISDLLLIQYYSIDLSAYGAEWNHLRKQLLLQYNQQSGTTRIAGN